MNAWVLIFCLKSLEMAFLSFPIEKKILAENASDFPRGKGPSASLKASAGCKHY